MVRRILGTLVLLLAFAGVAQAEVIHIVSKGDTVSQVVLTRTGSANWRRAGIKVVTSHGTVISQKNFDRILPGWQIQIKDSLAKTELIAKSTGQTVHQLCAKSTQPNCVSRLAKLNGLTKSQAAKPLNYEIYSFPNFVPTASIATPVAPIAPTVTPSAPVTPAPPKASGESAADRSQIPKDDRRFVMKIVFFLLAFGGIWWGIQQLTSEKPPPVESSLVVVPQAEPQEIQKIFEDGLRARLNAGDNQIRVEMEEGFSPHQHKFKVCRVRGRYPTLDNDHFRSDLKEMEKEYFEKGYRVNFSDFCTIADGVSVLLNRELS